jgi:molybdopterin/thiamine biosynthesis adenylyltransferase/rhodanese-related sulfurtransferase
VSGFDDRLNEIKSRIEETNVDSVYERWLEKKDREDVHLIDVRERDEFVDGHIEGAEFVPRGLLDMKIEGLVPDKNEKVILYCAGGTRSALAADTLQDLGYDDVESMDGGFGAWKEAGHPVHIKKTLSQDDMTRYSRHLKIPEVGEEGQIELLESKVLMLGAGGLGSPAALYLAAAGVGQIGIIDSDVVDRSNLQRQVLHTDDRVGESKTGSAKQTLNSLNPDIEIEEFETRLDKDNIRDIFEGYDLVVDGGDNFPTRYLINDACVQMGIPNVHGSVFRFEGQATVFDPEVDGPCYRCLYPEPPPPEMAPSCQEAGVLGVLPGIIGMMQANEVIKLLLDIGDPLRGRLLSFDGLKTEFREMQLDRDPECPVCSEDAEFDGFPDYEAFCSVA